MPLKLYILGRPGSGKSIAAHFIMKIARDMDYQAVRINDYEFLYNEFQIEQIQGRAKSQHARFKKTRNDGFEVKDPRVLDDALDSIRKLTAAACADMKNDLVIVEFARSDYSVALNRFPLEMLQGARFLFIETDVPTCIKRVKRRVASKNKSPDDTYVSVRTFKRFYNKDQSFYIPFGFMSEFGLSNEQVRVIHNVGAIWDFKAQISEFSQIILSEINKLRETDPVQNISPIISNCQVAK